MRALAALYASVEDVGGEWVPNLHAVSKLEGMPHHATLSRWWKQREKGADAQHRAAAQRARETARQDGADAFYRSTVEKLKKGATFVLHAKHRKTVGPGLDKLGLHNYARALREVAQLTEKLRGLTAPLEAPKEEADTGDPAAAVTALLQKNPELIAAALASMTPAARAAILARAEEEL
jgi:hypothetical protein